MSAVEGRADRLACTISDACTATGIMNDVLALAMDAGIRRFEAAPGNHDSEKALGQVLSMIDTPVELSSTIGIGQDLTNHTAVVKSLEDSLNRLQKRSIHSICLQAGAVNKWGKGLSKTLTALREMGLFHEVEIAVPDPDTARMALALEHVSAIRVQANLLDRRFRDTGIFDLADRSDVQIRIMDPFLDGLLLVHPDNLPPHLTAISPLLKLLRSIAAESGLTMIQTALCYVFEMEPAARVFCRIDTRQDAEHIAQCLSAKLPASSLETINHLIMNT